MKLSKIELKKSISNSTVSCTAKECIPYGCFRFSISSQIRPDFLQYYPVFYGNWCRMSGGTEMRYNISLKKANYQVLLQCYSRVITMVEFTAQKMKFSIKDFFSKCDQIRRKLRIWSHLLKKSLMENFIFCAVVLGLI